MAAIGLNPLVLKDVVFSVGADDYQTHVSNVTFTPTASNLLYQGLTPSATFRATTTAVYDVSLTYVQDWDTPNSLSAFLYDNEGAEVTVTFKPRGGVGASFTTTLIITPGAIGGAVNTFAESTITLAAKTKPVRVPGVAVIPTVTATAPTTGGIAGGTLVKVTGSKFTGSTAVHFGTTAATQFTVESDTVIYAVAPAQAAGSKPVKVTNATGQSTTTGAYTYA